MGAITITNHGSFKFTDKFLKHFSERWFERRLMKYGEMGVEALMNATPIDTGKTAASWDFEIAKRDGIYSIIWTNNNLSEGDSGPPVVVLLYYGHVTKQGGYVEGRDFITPAMQPIFDEIANDAWREMIGI